MSLDVIDKISKSIFISDLTTCFVSMTEAEGFFKQFFEKKENVSNQHFLYDVFYPFNLFPTSPGFYMSAVHVF